MIKLTKAIILDNDEYVPADTILYNYGENSLYSVAPSKLQSCPSKARNKVDKDCVIDFCRIPRECIDAEYLSNKLRKALIKGDDTISPFYCSIVGKSSVEERHITESTHIRNAMYGDDGLYYYDSKLRPINVVLISSIGELSIGAHHCFSNLPQLENESHYETVVTYYYSGSANLKVKKLAYNKFYADFRAYRTAIDFSELSVGDMFDCYYIINNKVHFAYKVYIIDLGQGNDWLDKFQRAHSSTYAIEETFPEDDIHIFARLCHYDKERKENVSELKMLHKSSCGFIFAKPKVIKTLIKEVRKLI